MTQQFDPWANGTPWYRRTLLAGMTLTFLGVFALIGAATIASDSQQEIFQRVGLVLVGLGILTHLVSLQLRRRQAKIILQQKAREEEAQRIKAHSKEARGSGAHKSKKR